MNTSRVHVRARDRNDRSSGVLTVLTRIRRTMRVGYLRPAPLPLGLVSSPNLDGALRRARGGALDRGRHVGLRAPLRGRPRSTPRFSMSLCGDAPGVPWLPSRTQAMSVASLAAARPTAKSVLPLIACARTSGGAQPRPDLAAPIGAAERIRGLRDANPHRLDPNGRSGSAPVARVGPPSSARRVTRERRRSVLRSSRSFG